MVHEEELGAEGGRPHATVLHAQHIILIIDHRRLGQPPRRPPHCWEPRRTRTSSWNCSLYNIRESISRAARAARAINPLSHTCYLRPTMGELHEPSTASVDCLHVPREPKAVSDVSSFCTPRVPRRSRVKAYRRMGSLVLAAAAICYCRYVQGSTRANRGAALLRDAFGCNPCHLSRFSGRRTNIARR